ncbi:unnamed protein product [Plutella xylostella]|uniref:(diamondback moth) hypothetical protein n=1 Tax=Plutella xylostella TaxID=51655 RepID=A0A8S4DEI8_PLUXY|nr:unnamed protein product [Plutella xylostella]
MRRCDCCFQITVSGSEEKAPTSLKMSFVDLAALATHRRSEMEARIAVLAGKCDQAQTNLKKLKLQAQCLVKKLNCNPTELKENFLTGMKQLDEFIYMVTDFNLSVGRIEETASHEFTPVQDASHTALQPSFQASNLFDVLSDPVPSTSMAMAFPKQNVSKPASNKQKKKKLPKLEDVLIEFSSTSCSQESVPQDLSIEVKLEPDYEPPVEAVNNLTIKDEPSSSPAAVDKWNLPEQSVLETDMVYQGLIMHVDGKSLWIITDEIGATELMVSMREYYMQSDVSLTRSQLRALSYCYCAYYDHDSDCSYRCMLIAYLEDSDMAELFLVDTGEVRFAPSAVVRPLARAFCSQPPFARCCYLAGVDLIEHHSPELMKKQEDFLKSYIGLQCDIEVDDNTSETLGVYIRLSAKELLNQMLVDRGFATPIGKLQSEAAAAPVEASPVRGPPEMVPDEDFSLSDGPEYEDPLEAVTVSIEFIGFFIRTWPQQRGRDE